MRRYPVNGAVVGNTALSCSMPTRDPTLPKPCRGYTVSFLYWWSIRCPEVAESSFVGKQTIMKSLLQLTRDGTDGSRWSKIVSSALNPFVWVDGSSSAKASRDQSSECECYSRFAWFISSSQSRPSALVYAKERDFTSGFVNAQKLSTGDSISICVSQPTLHTFITTNMPWTAQQFTSCAGELVWLHPRNILNILENIYK